jgi:hypothetical protein
MRKLWREREGAWNACRSQNVVPELPQENSARQKGNHQRGGFNNDIN